MTIVHQPYDGIAKLIPLYRHCDGYLALAGAAIAEVLAAGAPDCEAVLAGLLSMRYERETGPSEPIYRAATWLPEAQGDLEHVYYIAPAATLDDNGNRVRPAVTQWTVRHYARPARSWDAKHEDYRNWPGTTYDLARLIEAVNKDRAEINARLKARSPEAEGYEMLTVTHA